MDAAQALSDLTEVSSQIGAAVLISADGTVLASTLPDGDATERLARAAHELVEAGEQAPRVSGHAWLVQLEVALVEGSVFVVRDRKRIVAAVTAPEPTAGLVFYDLKSCLRAAAADEGDGKPRPRARGAKSEGGSA